MPLRAERSRGDARAYASVKCKPDGTSNNILTMSLQSPLLRSISFPPNLHLRAVPIPSNSFLSTAARVPDSVKLSKFGSCTMTSQTCRRVIAFVLTNKVVTDCGKLQSSGLQNGGAPPYPIREIFSVFEKHWVNSKRLSGTRYFPPVQTRRFLTW